MAFESIEITSPDLIERAVSRTLLQFRESPVFLDTIAALTSEVQVLIDAIVEVIKYRGPADARGEQLNAIGRIVGQLRTLIGFDAIEWLKADTLYQGADQVPVWTAGAPTSGDYEADDSWYRQLIEAKVARNMIKYCSVPEIQEFVRLAFNIDISFVTVDTMTVQIIVPDSTSTNIINLLSSYTETDIAEHIYFLPLAAGVQIASVIRYSDYVDSSLGSSS